MKISLSFLQNIWKFSIFFHSLLRIRKTFYDGVIFIILSGLLCSIMTHITYFRWEHLRLSVFISYNIGLYLYILNVIKISVKSIIIINKHQQQHGSIHCKCHQKITIKNCLKIPLGNDDKFFASQTKPFKIWDTRSVAWFVC